MRCLIGQLERACPASRGPSGSRSWSHSMPSKLRRASCRRNLPVHADAQADAHSTSFAAASRICERLGPVLQSTGVHVQLATVQKVRAAMPSSAGSRRRRAIREACLDFALAVAAAGHAATPGQPAARQSRCAAAIMSTKACERSARHWQRGHAPEIRASARRAAAGDSP